MALPLHVTLEPVIEALGNSLIVTSTVAQLTEEEEEEAREGKKIEPKNVKTFSQEVLVSSLTPGLQNIVKGENSPLKRGILEVK